MTLSGWIVMSVSIGAVTGLLVWCIRRVLAESEAPDRLHAQTEIDTHDQE